MSDYPVNVLEASIYSDLPKHTKVWNKSSLSYSVWINVPIDLCRTHSLFQLDDVTRGIKEIHFQDAVSRECGKPWFEVDMSLLNLDSGQHIYKMSFINTFSNDISCLYFSYIIQDDTPDKPYMYMKR